MIIRIIGLALALITATSCSTPRTFRFDPESTPREVREGRAAIANWNAHLAPEEQLSESPSGAWRVTFGFASERHDGITCFDADTEIDGEHCWEGRWIRLNVDVDDDRLRAEFEHEIGHVLGLEHVDDETAVMFHSTGGPDLSPSDIVECQIKDRCPN